MSSNHARTVSMPSQASRAEEVKIRFESQYPTYQYHLVEFVTEHLADLSRTFRGDLQEMMVLAIIGQLTLRARKATLAEPDQANSKSIETAITASRLADVTGVPRQTVRRKLKSLEERGWIERGDGASYRLAIKDGQAPVRNDLSAIDQRGMDRAVRLFCGLERLVAEPSS